MIINKNNGIILIEESNTFTGGLLVDKPIYEYTITVKDKEDQEKLKGCLMAFNRNGIIKYRFRHNSNNINLVNYIVNELKKHKYIKD